MTEREVCSACSHDSSCQTRDEMRRRHGTPAVFRQAVMAATAEFVSLQEAQGAIRTYEQDYARAPEAIKTKDFEVGMPVRILRGSFSGVVATVEWVPTDADHFICVLMPEDLKVLAYNLDEIELVMETS